MVIVKKILFVIAAFIVFIASGRFPASQVLAASATCDSLQVTSGNNAFPPSTVSFVAHASNATAYHFFFGDGTSVDSGSPTITHQYTASGSYTAVVNVGGSSCQTIFSLIESPFESQKSGCSNVFVQGGNTVPVGSDVKFVVTGFENKNGIKLYQLNFGNGQVKEDVANNFDETFDTPGTYSITGQIQDSKGKWVGSPTCQTQLYVTGTPIVVQPSTGTPTWFTLTGIAAGAVLMYLLFTSKPRRTKSTRRR